MGAAFYQAVEGCGHLGGDMDKNGPYEPAH